MKAETSRKNLKTTRKFERDMNRVKKRGWDTRKIRDAIGKLERGESLEHRYRRHPLRGSWDGFWECHLGGDWVLVWTYEGDSIVLTRTGTHSDLFG